MDVFSERLRWLRERKGFSQKEMAEKLGISQSYYFKFEKGTGEPNLETLVKLPGILNESLEFLLGMRLDKHGTRLIREFMSSRRSYDYAKERINTLKSLLESGDINELISSNKIDMFVRFKEKLVEAEKEYKHALYSLIEYLKEVPGVPPHLLEKSEWENFYQNRESRINKDK